MFKKIALFLICLSFSLQGLSQEYSVNSKIAPDKLKADFSILVSTLKDHHPGLYDFFSQSQFDSLTNANLNALTDSLTEAQFHVVIRKFTRFIGCGHTTALPSKKWYAAIREDQHLIPIHVKLSGDQLFLRKVFGEYTDSLIDSRIVEIEGVPAKEIIAEIKSIIERDGFTETMVNRNLERLFQTYYLFLYGMKEKYEVVFETTSGDFIETRLTGVVGDRISYRQSLEIDTLLHTKTARFGVLRSDKNKAVLDLASFPNSDYKKFYKQVFRQLAEMDSVELVLDLRGNGGGYFPNGSTLLRYLMDDNFSMDFKKAKKRAKKNKHMDMNFISDVTRFIFSTIPDRNKEDPARNYQIRTKPVKRNHFDGNVIVMVDGFTFSSGSYVASKLKNSRNAVVVGEETGGGEVGFNATLSWNLDLPNSGVRVIIPRYHVNVQPEMENIGRGVMPNAMIEDVISVD